MYQIIANEADFVVISKAPNVDFHSQSGDAGVVAQVSADLQLPLYPVHRLDTMTSGLILLAKSSAAAATFTQLFSQHQVQKYYLAIAQGKPKKKQGSIIGDMAKSRRGSYKLLRSTENPAVTQFFSQAILTDKPLTGLRLYVLKPLTGKTHQLRVALASIGVPIVGDQRYQSALNQSNRFATHLDRGYLHAWQLEFIYQGQAYHYLAPTDSGELFQLEAVQAQLQVWQQPSSLQWPKR